ncbi:MAG: hypothetical protein IPO62_17845 [Saprospiraceae bacterium]|nr:hypothetical protein [Saprospiraceae bacterium]
MSYTEAIKALQNLNLSSYPESEIKQLIMLLGKLGIIQMNFPPGKIIYRARPNGDTSPFTNRKELSYKPSIYNTTYMRASTPKSTMFYGSIIPEYLNQNELKMARVISAAETSYLLRDKTTSGEQKLTFSKWLVTDNMRLVAICYKEDFINFNSHYKELYHAYQAFLSNYPKDIQQKYLDISNFIASEYSKEPINNDYDYMISAIFSEISTNQGFDGVYYPSVRTGYHGFNVAIIPEAVDNYMKLKSAMECTIYKHDDRTIVDNESIALIDDDTLDFSFNLVDPKNHA